MRLRALGRAPCGRCGQEEVYRCRIDRGRCRIDRGRCCCCERREAMVR